MFDEDAMYESKDMEESISDEVGLGATAKRFYRRWKNQHDTDRRYGFTYRYFQFVDRNTKLWNTRYDEYPELGSDLHSKYCCLLKLWDSIDDEWDILTIIPWFERHLEPHWEFIVYHAAFLSACAGPAMERQFQNELSGK